MFLLKFEDKNCWVAPWNGDPGKTMRKYKAKLFKTKEEAELYKDKIIKANAHRELHIIVEEL